jgi:predicted  nucleic acid-binding Zn-ribbon protein
MSGGKLKKELEFLASLQSVDKQLNYLELSKGDLPKTVSSLKSSLKELERTITESKTEIEKIDQERRSIEGLISLAKDKLKKYQSQLYDVTSNKEYDAITHEIEMKKKEVDEGELQILEVDQEQENLQTKLSESSEEKEQIGKELKAREEELAKLVESSELKEIELYHSREKITVRLKKPMLSRYERIRKAKSGIAVVPITRDACGGCYKTIPPQKIVEIERLKELIQCEVCGRILIPENKLSKTVV